MSKPPDLTETEGSTAVCSGRDIRHVLGASQRWIGLLTR